MKYIVYTELVEDAVERWYYGTYEYERANEVAQMLGSSYPVYHCVCSEEAAAELGIKNMPRR